MARESYDDLIFQLGDLARARLAEKPNAPRSMDRVFTAEDGVLAKRDEIAALEAELNGEDAAFKDFLEQQEAERVEQKGVVRKWARAVEGIEVRSRDLRKRISTQKATLRYEKVSLNRAEEKHKDFELRQGHEVAKIRVSQENLKLTRLKLMRKTRDIEDLEHEFTTLLTPRPGQPGAQGILAHKRLLEMEDEAETREAEHKARMEELDKQIAAAEEELKAAEEYLDEAIFLLGEEVYADRISDTECSTLYPRLDKAK
jgi:hypothetical protein